MASSGETNGPSGKSGPPGPGTSDRGDLDSAGASLGDDDGSDDTKVSNPEDLLGSEAEATIAQADISLADSGPLRSDEDEDDRTAPGARPLGARSGTDSGPGDDDDNGDTVDPNPPSASPAPRVAYPVQSGPPVKHYPDVSPNRDKRPPAPSPPPSHGPVDYPRVSRDGGAGYRHYSMPVGADRPEPPPPPMVAPTPRRRFAVAMIGSGAGGVVLGLVIGLAIGGGGGGDATDKVVSPTDAVPLAGAMSDAMASSPDAGAMPADASVPPSDGAPCVPGQPGCAELPPTQEGVILAKSTRLDRPVLTTIEAPVAGTVVRSHVKDQAVVDKGDKLFTVRAAATRDRPRQRTVEAPVAGLISGPLARGKDIDEGASLALVLDHTTWLVSVEVSSDAVRPPWFCVATTPDQTHRAPCRIDSTERLGNRSRVDVRIRSADAPWLIVPDHPLIIELAPPR